MKHRVLEDDTAEQELCLLTSGDETVASVLAAVRAVVPDPDCRTQIVGASCWPWITTPLSIGNRAHAGNAPLLGDDPDGKAPQGLAAGIRAVIGMKL